MAIDFAILGAPKCGTTSVAHYLSTHPGVDFAAIKEPFFHNREVPAFNGIDTQRDYDSLFANDGGLKGEGTTWSLYSSDAVPNMLRDNPHTRFIVCVREPVSAVISWHAHAQLVGAETETDVRRAWQATDARLRSKPQIPVYGDIRMLDYKNLYSYGDQVERLLALCPSDRMLFVQFDELCVAPQTVYQNVLSFLGLEDDGREDFPVLYPRMSTRSSLLRHLGSRFSYQQRIWLTRQFAKLKIDLYALYFALNTSKERKKHIAPEIRDMIASAYQPQLEKFERLTGIRIQKMDDETAG